MNDLEYYLMLESGYTGEYERREGHYLVKKGTVADMLHDSGMLCGYDFNKVIPNLKKMNEILLSGEYSRLVEWEPFTINKKEYEEMLQQLLSISLDRPYRKE